MTGGTFCSSFTKFTASVKMKTQIVRTTEGNPILPSFLLFCCCCCWFVCLWATRRCHAHLPKTSDPDKSMLHVTACFSQTSAGLLSSSDSRDSGIIFSFFYPPFLCTAPLNNCSKWKVYIHTYLDLLFFFWVVVVCVCVGGGGAGGTVY